MCVSVDFLRKEKVNRNRRVNTSELFLQLDTSNFKIFEKS